MGGGEDVGTVLAPEAAGEDGGAVPAPGVADVFEAGTVPGPGTGWEDAGLVPSPAAGEAGVLGASAFAAGVFLEASVLLLS